MKESGAIVSSQKLNRWRLTMQERYNFSEIEKKWQKNWEETKAFKVVEDPDK